MHYIIFLYRVSLDEEFNIFLDKSYKILWPTEFGSCMLGYTFVLYMKQHFLRCYLMTAIESGAFNRTSEVEKRKKMYFQLIDLESKD